MINPEVEKHVVKFYRDVVTHKQNELLRYYLQTTLRIPKYHTKYETLTYHMQFSSEKVMSIESTSQS